MNQHDVDAALAHLQKKANESAKGFHLMPKLPAWSKLTQSQRRSLLVRSASFLIPGWLIINYIASRPPRMHSVALEFDSIAFA